MDKKIVKRIGMGIGLYMVFAVSVVSLFPDDPDSMGWEDRQEFNKVHIGKLELGVGRQEVMTLLGSPDISEAKSKGDDRLQVMFYRTQHKKSDGITTQDECTPLLFKNDSLVAWGETAYQEYASL